MFILRDEASPYRAKVTKGVDGYLHLSIHDDGMLLGTLVEHKTAVEIVHALLPFVAKDLDLMALKVEDVSPVADSLRQAALILDNESREDFAFDWDDIGPIMGPVADYRKAAEAFTERPTP